MRSILNATLFLCAAIHAVAATPAVVSVIASPASGSASAVTVTVSDADGYQHIGLVDLLINSALNGQAACYLAITQSATAPTALYLVDDAGDSQGPYTGFTFTGSTGSWLGTSGASAYNSQCTVYGTGSTAWGSGNTLTVTIEIGFPAPGFDGAKVLYASAADISGDNSGWQSAGVFTVGSPMFSMTPASGAAMSQTYAFTVSEQNSWPSGSVLDVLVNKDLDGASACYFVLLPQAEMLYMVNDAGTGLISGPIGFTGSPPSATGTAFNSQCTVGGSGSTYSISGTTLTLTAPIAFNSSFAGDRIFYLSSGDSNWDSGWIAAGAVTVEPPLTIMTSSLPVLAVGSPYSQPLQASGGSPPYTWAPDTGSTLPQGFALNAAGMFSGTAAAAGVTSFRVRATDSSGGSALVTLTLTGVAITASQAPNGCPLGAYTYPDGNQRSYTYCADHFDGRTTTGCSVSGADVTASIVNATYSYVTIGYTADTSAQPGSRTATCTATGVVGPVPVDTPLSVYDVQPQIQSITPNPITQSTVPVPVTFTGIGFGTSPPTLSFSPTQLPYTIVPGPNVCGASGHTPTCFVALLPANLPGTFWVAVQSKGNNGTSFQAGGSPLSVAMSPYKPYGVVANLPTISLLNTITTSPANPSLYAPVGPNSAGYFVLYGSWFQGGAGLAPVVSISGPSGTNWICDSGGPCTLNCSQYCVVSDGQINVQFAFAGTPVPAGQYQITVTNLYGASQQDIHFNVINIDSLTVVQPATPNAATGAVPPVTPVTVTSTSSAFATCPTPTTCTSDLVTVLKNSGMVNVTATVGGTTIQAAAGAGQVAWQLNEDQSDTVNTPVAVPAPVNGPPGAQYTFIPSYAGNFRVTAYVDLNTNGVFDEGEQLRILRIAVVQMTVQQSIFNTNNNLPVAITLPLDQTQTGVTTAANNLSTVAAAAMSAGFVYLLEGGGNTRMIGTAAVTIGDVGNLTADTFTGSYPGTVIGTGTEQPGGPLPMVDTGRVAVNQSTSGGMSAFRDTNAYSTPANPNIGILIQVISADAPKFTWAKVHRTTGNDWGSTADGSNFEEFLVAFSGSFPMTYSMLSKAGWTVSIIGTSSSGWAGSSISGDLAFSPIGANDQVQVSGMSYAKQHTMTYQP